MENSCRRKHTAATADMEDATEKATVIMETAKDAATVKATDMVTEKAAATVKATNTVTAKAAATVKATNRVTAKDAVMDMEMVRAAAIKENNRPTDKSFWSGGCIGFRSIGFSLMSTLYIWTLCRILPIFS